MSVSKHEDKMITLQQQLQENQHDLKEYLADLDGWENSIKQKEQTLTRKTTVEEIKLPPVRNSLDKKKVKKKNKSTSGISQSDNGHKVKTQRINSYDYRSWDKFDIEAALEEVDGSKESSSEYETDEDLEMERKKHLAEEEKEQGNVYFRTGDYDRAINCYTRGIVLDPSNALLPANRAMAFLKQDKFGGAEVDATTAIALDPLYLKAYMRRASARVGLQKLNEAQQDYKRILNLDPQHSSAAVELEKLSKVLNRSVEDQPAVKSFTTNSGIVMPIYIPPELRSKKPFRRIQVEEIGRSEDTSQREAVAKATAKQSETKQKMVERDEHLFSKYKIEHEERKVIEVSPGESITMDISSQKKLTNEVSQPESVGMSAEVALATSDAATSDPATRYSEQRTRSKNTVPFSLSLDDISEKDIPKTSFQFQADYKVLKHSSPAFYRYFKRIPPRELPSLFGEMLDSATLIHILTVFRDMCVPINESFEEQLTALTQVKRFDMTVMFLSKKDKTIVEDLIVYLRRTSTSKPEAITRLSKRFGVL